MNADKEIVGYFIYLKKKKLHVLLLDGAAGLLVQSTPRMHKQFEIKGRKCLFNDELNTFYLWSFRV